MTSRLTILFIAMLTWPVLIFGQNTFRADNQGITYTGRIETHVDGAVSYDWSGVYLQTDFTGGYFAIEASETGTSWHNLFIDGQWVRKLKITGDTPQTIVLAERLSKGVHRLRLQKCTEGQYGRTTIHSCRVAKNGTLRPVERQSRMIEVYGDSYTCGYGTESQKANDPFSIDTENCDKAYGCIIARYFDADYALTAHSGQGMVRDWGDSKQISDINMSVRYTRIYDEYSDKPYAFDLYTPQLVIINLGTNDFSPVAIPTPEQYVDAYVKMLITIKSRYPGVKILCISLETLRQRTASLGDVYMANPLDGMVTVERDMGADWHPNYQGQRKIAMALIPQISAIMGWELNDKTVK